MSDSTRRQELHPSELVERYEQLVAVLGKLDEHFVENKLAAAVTAVWAVAEFLKADPRVQADNRIRPLLAAYYALLDESIGGTSPLLQPIREKAQTSARPPRPSLDLLRGGAATAVEILVKAGMSRADAGKFTAAELEKLGARAHAGKPVTSGMVLRWRDEMGARAPLLAQEFYRHLGKYPPPETLAEAKSMASRLLRESVVA